MAMALIEKPIELSSIRRTHDHKTQIKAELSLVDPSTKNYSVAINGNMHDFRRVGRGWVEEGQELRPDFHVYKDAVLFLGTKIPSDAVSAHETEYGIAFGFKDYY